MAKRRLTRRQQWRINKIQQEREDRARRQSDRVLEDLTHGELGSEQAGLVIAHYGSHVEVESQGGQRHRCRMRTNLGQIVTGDQVIWRPAAGQGGVVVAVSARHSELSRPDARGQLRLIAANIDRIFLVTAPQPRTPFGLIDRYLIAAENVSICPVIVINKADLLKGEAEEWAEQVEQLYQNIGYQVLTTSTRSNAELAPLRAAMRGRTSIFVGQSGVGKTSLVNHLLPEAGARTGALSQSTGKGMHTTTTAQLFHLPDGGDIIDSPGIREFGLGHISDQQLLDGFIDFHPYLGKCKFRNCLHQHEPGCAVKAAVEAGHISPKRFASYHQIRDSLDSSD